MILCGTFVTIMVKTCSNSARRQARRGDRGIRAFASACLGHQKEKGIGEGGGEKRRRGRGKITLIRGTRYDRSRREEGKDRMGRGEKGRREREERGVKDGKARGERAVILIRGIRYGKGEVRRGTKGREGGETRKEGRQKERGREKGRREGREYRDQVARRGPFIKGQALTKITQRHSNWEIASLIADLAPRCTGVAKHLAIA